MEHHSHNSLWIRESMSVFWSTRKSLLSKGINHGRIFRSGPEIGSKSFGQKDRMESGGNSSLQKIHRKLLSYRSFWQFLWFCNSQYISNCDLRVNGYHRSIF